MPADQDRWNSKLSEIRLLLADFLRRSPDSRETAAALIEHLEELNSLYRGRVDGVPGDVRAGLADRPRRRAGRHVYKIAKAKRGMALEEYFMEGRPPFRCPEKVYAAIIDAVAGLTEPTSFEDLLRNVRKLAGEDVPDYRVRMCLRFWSAGEPCLVEKVGTRYRPQPDMNFRREARQAWRDLAERMH